MTQDTVVVTQSAREQAEWFISAILGGVPDGAGDLKSALAVALTAAEQRGFKLCQDAATTLRPMSEAPRDQSMILARYNPRDDHPDVRFKGRWFSIWHEGVTEGGYDMGWALYPGYGGVSDANFDGWLPLPDAIRTLSIKETGNGE